VLSFARGLRCCCTYGNLREMWSSFFKRDADGCAHTSVSAAINDLDTGTGETIVAPNETQLMFTDVQTIAPDATPAAAVINTPVSSLQSLARRKKQGWGNASLVTYNSRPASSSGTQARDFREVCVSLRRSTEVGLCIHVLLHVYMRFVFVQFCTYTLNMFT